MRMPILAIAAAALGAALFVAPSLAEPVPTKEELERLDAQQPAQTPMAAPTTPVQAGPIAPPPLETVNVVGRRVPDNGYRLASGDKVRVTVYDEADLSGEFQVDGSGNVYLPLIGQTRAAGYTTQTLGLAIAASLANGYVNNPRVSVEVTTYRPFYIIGEVNKPGEYAYVNDMTAENAVAMAGGYTPKADTDDLYVRAEGSTQEHEVPADATTRVHPGDVIRVERDGAWKVADFLSPILPVIGPACSVIIGTYC